jgi:hypothetical protein
MTGNGEKNTDKNGESGDGLLLVCQHEPRYDINQNNEYLKPFENKYSIV